MKYAQIEWNKGTPRSARFDDVYFSADSGIEESRYVFLQQNELPQRWNASDSFVIAETGFGTGLNFLVTMQAWLQSAADDARLHYISIENRPVSPADIQRLAGRWPELDACVHELLQHYPPPLPGMHLLELGGGRIRLQLLFADVEEALEQFSNEVDAWYLDGFAPARNPQMWSARAFELIGRHTRVGGSFATYTAAGAVRRGLTDAGFVVQKAKGHGAKRDMLRGFIFEQRCYVVDKPWFKLPLTGFAQRHAIIVGAGLAGLATAWSLCRRSWDITLIDRHASVAAGASGNPAGLLMPRMTQDETLDARFYLNAYVHAQQCLDRLQAGSEQPFWFKTGNLLLGDTEKLQRLCQSHRFDDDFIRYVHSADSEAVAGVELEQDALLLVNAGWVNVRLLCERLRFECGDRLRYLHADAAVIRRDHDNWLVSDQDDGCIASAKCVVLANAAAWPRHRRAGDRAGCRCRRFAAS